MMTERFKNIKHHFVDFGQKVSLKDETVSLIMSLENFYQLGQSRLRPAGLDWIVGPEYNFGVFSTSLFAPAALSSVDEKVFIFRHTIS